MGRIKGKPEKRTEKKTAASRENGKKGGRPHKPDAKTNAERCRAYRQRKKEQSISLNYRTLLD